MRRSPLPIALIVFAVLTVGLTWPQIVRPHEIRAHFDPLFSIWRLAWIAHQLPRDPWHLFDTNIFYPEPLTLAYSDAILLPGLLAAPLFWSGVSGVTTYNAFLMVAFITAGLAMFVLVRRLTGSLAGAYLAGIMFAFSPYRFEHYHHLELLITLWMPLAFYCVHRAVETGKVKWGVATGLLVTFQTLSSLYYGIFLATSLPILAVILAIGEVRTQRRNGNTPTSVRTILQRPMLSLAAGAAVAAVLLLPYAALYSSSRDIVGVRTMEEIRAYSAVWTDYLASPPNNALYGWTSEPFGDNERNLFPGLLIVALALVALWPPLNRVKVAYAVVLLIALDASRGLNGVLYPWLHQYLLPYQGLRVPARWSVVVCLALAVLAGLGLSAFSAEFHEDHYGSWPRPCSRASWWPNTACGRRSNGLVFSRRRLRRMPGWPVIPAPSSWSLPLPEPERAGEAPDALYMYYSTFHWQPMLNGYSGYTPPSYQFLLAIMKRFPNDRSIDELRFRKVDYIVLHTEMTSWGQSPPPDVIEALDRRPEVQLIAEFPGPFGRSRIYKLLPELR